jgi:hypothetical protein
MKCIDLYLKVEVDLPDNEDPRKLAEQLCRMLCKTYAVRKAELSSHIEHDASPQASRKPPRGA